MSEILKLILILLGGGVIIGVGLYVQLKNKRESQPNSNYSQSGQNPNEDKAKQYIEAYKSQYPKESIKTGLKNLGISEFEADEYLEKYF